MDERSARRFRRVPLLAVGVLVAALLTPAGVAQAEPASVSGPMYASGQPTVTAAAAFDTSKPVRELAPARRVTAAQTPKDEQGEEEDAREQRLREAVDHAFSGDGAVQSTAGRPGTGGTRANFEGLSNADNFALLGGRVNPPDPNGEVGRNHYVETVNLAFAVYSKTGTLLAGPATLGSLWAAFPVTECADQSGDPVVLYDQMADRWIITQFTTKGINFPKEPLNPFYNCIAISTTGDPTGSYYRYAFTTGFNFPDYPKYGVWRGAHVIATLEVGGADPSLYGLRVYGAEARYSIGGWPQRSGG